MSWGKLASATMLAALALLLILPSAPAPVHAEDLIITKTVDKTVVQEGDIITITVNITNPSTKLERGFPKENPIYEWIPSGLQFLKLESVRIYRNQTKTMQSESVNVYEVGNGIHLYPVVLRPLDQLHFQYKKVNEDDVSRKSPSFFYFYDD